MKKIVKIIFLFILPSLVYSQKNNENCLILQKELQGEYSGGCKKGLAHGQGKAIGTDSYEGNFKKGYPHGKGKYIWDENTYYKGRFKKGKKNGFGKYFSIINEKDSITIGYWENDKYIGKKENKQGYKTIKKISIERVNYVYKGNHSGKNEVMIKFAETGLWCIGRIQEISLSGNNGTYINQDLRCGYVNINVPFKASLTFMAPSKSGGVFNLSSLDFEIFKEGVWEIVIHY